MSRMIENSLMNNAIYCTLNEIHHYLYKLTESHAKEKLMYSYIVVICLILTSVCIIVFLTHRKNEKLNLENNSTVSKFVVLYMIIGIIAFFTGVKSV